MARPAPKKAPKSVDIVAIAPAIAERLSSSEAKTRLVVAATASKARSREIVSSVAVDPRFLAKRVTF